MPDEGFKQLCFSADASIHQQSLSKLSPFGVEQVVTIYAFEFAHAHVAHTIVQRLQWALVPLSSYMSLCSLRPFIQICITPQSAFVPDCQCSELGSSL